MLVLHYLQITLRRVTRTIKCLRSGRVPFSIWQSYKDLRNHLTCVENRFRETQQKTKSSSKKPAVSSNNLSLLTHSSVLLANTFQYKLFSMHSLQYYISVNTLQYNYLPCFAGESPAQ